MLYLIFSLALIVGALAGWLAAERYIAFMAHERHDFEELFEQNPHPEIFNDDGEIYRGDYTAITFDPGFDPEQFDPDTDIRKDDDEF